MTIEIVRCFDGSYYCNVPDTPEYVSYQKLRAEIKRSIGTDIGKASDYVWQRLGVKKYAYKEV